MHIWLKPTKVQSTILFKLMTRTMRMKQEEIVRFQKYAVYAINQIIPLSNVLQQKLVTFATLKVMSKDIVKNKEFVKNVEKLDTLFLTVSFVVVFAILLCMGPLLATCTIIWNRLKSNA